VPAEGKASVFVYSVHGGHLVRSPTIHRSMLRTEYSKGPERENFKICRPKATLKDLEYQGVRPQIQIPPLRVV
jgi:hypothetical protein